MRRIMKNDTVEVIAGADRGSRGRVLQIVPEKGRVLVEGVNYIWRHVRPSQQNPQGGRVQKEASVAMSNVMLVCPECDKASRVGYKVAEGGKVRVCAKCGKEIPATGR